MQTVLDIIRHYSGAGKEDNMKHDCKSKNGTVYIEKEGEDWKVIAKAPGTFEVSVTISTCPFCGVDLNKWEEEQLKRKYEG